MNFIMLEKKMSLVNERKQCSRCLVEKLFILARQCYLVNIYLMERMCNANRIKMQIFLLRETLQS